MIWIRLKDAWLVLCYGYDARTLRIEQTAFERGKQYGRQEADLSYRPLMIELQESTAKLNQMSRMLTPVLNVLSAFRKE